MFAPRPAVSPAASKLEARRCPRRTSPLLVHAPSPPFDDTGRIDEKALARLPGLPARPGVPALDLDPGAHAAALVVGVGLPHVVGAEAIDVAVVAVVLERDDVAAQADVVI